MRRSSRHYAPPPELNLVPMLDMISLLIQSLLINIQFGVLAQIEAGVGAAGGEAVPGKLSLDVGVDDKGYRVSWSEGDDREHRDIPCKVPTPGAACGPDEYDGSGLRALLEQIKGSHPDETAAILAPSGPVPFEVIARAMDAIRADRAKQPMFPDIAIADGR